MNALGGENISNIVHCELQNRFEQADVPDVVTADDVPDSYRVNNIRLHLPDNRFTQIGMEHTGKSAEAKVEPEKLLLRTVLSLAAGMELGKLGERKGVDIQRDIPTG
jgi:hypothetical protein